LLKIEKLDAQYYISLVSKGPLEKEYQAIRKDTKRTFRYDSNILRRFDEAKLSRVLNALLRSFQELQKPEDKDKKLYMQGMNFLCATFLYVMPELDAFYCARELILNHCPLYYNLTNISSSKSSPKGKNEDKANGDSHENDRWAMGPAVYLLERCLESVDPILQNHIVKSRQSGAWLYTQYVMALNTSIPPGRRTLEEAVKLWDFLMAFGVHLNIIFTAARITLLRDDILKTPNPNIHDLMNRVPLDAEAIIQVSVQMVRQIPRTLFEKIVRHPREDL